MKSCVNAYLAGRGYRVNTRAITLIDVCDQWYSNEDVDGFHRRTNLNGAEVYLEKMNMAKRCCADDANLCEIISVTPAENEKSQEFIEALLDDNRFDVMYREQLEKTAATGTAGAYIYLDGAEYYEQNNVITARGGEIKINYVDADCIIPLTVENKLVTECAFAVTNVIKGKDLTTLVIFTKNSAGNYQAETVRFDENGTEIPDAYTQIQLGDVKPFSIMTVAEVNNLKYMDGYGLPKIYNNIPLFRACDLCYSLLYGDLDKGDKLVFINELLACIGKDENGQAVLTPQQKEIFILLGEKLPDQDSVIKEYNPEIRVDDITKAFELVLSLISMGFGYGTKKYTFENGQITTATEYIGEKQDEIQELNKQRKQAVAYIEDIVHAAMWFANAFHGEQYDVDEELVIEFDDSYIEDKQARLERLRMDALSFPEVIEFKIRYVMEALSLPREEAIASIDGAEIEDDQED